MAQTGQPYAYTGDDPVNATDPLGLKTKCKKGHSCPPTSNKKPAVNHGSSGQSAKCVGPGAPTQAQLEACGGGYTITGKPHAPTDSWSGNNPLKSVAGTAAGVAAPILGPTLPAFGAAIAQPSAAIALAQILNMGLVTTPVAQDIPQSSPTPEIWQPAQIAQELGQLYKDADGG